MFTACAKLKKVNSYNTTPPTILATTFDESTYASAMLVVPESAQNAYKSDQYWKQFSQFGTLGISNVESEGWYVVGKGFIESTVPVTVYTITGASVGTFTGYKAVAPGIYIISNGNKVAKVVVR